MYEPWFWLALLSALAAGGEAFLHKVIAMRGGDIYVIAAVSSFVASLGLLVAVVVFGGFSAFGDLTTLFACAGGGLFLFTLVFRVKALESIDTAIFFPLYKVSRSVFAIVFGLLFFSEVFSAMEWVGLLIGMSIPLLLLSPAEGQRQNNLARGLVMLAGAVVAGSASIAFFKQGATLTTNIWQYVFVSQACLFVISALATFKKHGLRTSHYMLSQLSNGKTVRLVAGMSVTQAVGTIGMIFAFSANGQLGVVYAINSIYILIPIVLSAVIFREHLNARKILAIGLSVATVGLLG